jgi:signal-transduction protein with cAMP-binding, CBS, and nucleotidyltransferase domain
MQQFSKVLQSIRRLPPEFHRQLEGNANCQSLRRHDLIKSIGHDYDKLMFIEEGVVRAYWRTGESQETAWFKKENEFLLLLKSIGDQEINENLEIEMATDGKLWEIPVNVVSRLATNSAYSTTI